MPNLNTAFHRAQPVVIGDGRAGREYQPNLVSAPSKLLFDLTSVDSWWLAGPSGEWERHESHLDCKAFVNGVKVANITAERGFAILKSFALSVRGQQLFQWLLQALEQHSVSTVADKVSFA